MSKAATLDLRELRVSCGKTTNQMGISQPWAIALEHGRRMPEANAVAKIATALGIEAPVVYAACQESVRRASAVQVSRQRRARVHGRAG